MRLRCRFRAISAAGGGDGHGVSRARRPAVQGFLKIVSAGEGPDSWLMFVGIDNEAS
jgi:hypothetical protein